VPEISIAHEVKAVPAFVFIGPDKKIADRIDGANPPELTKKCNYYNSAGGLVLRTRLEQTTSPSNGFTGDEKLSDNLNSKLKKTCQSQQMYGVYERIFFGAKMWIFETIGGTFGRMQRRLPNI